jgi:hypothetical protein
MQIEIEKKYNLTEDDYSIIKNKTIFLREVNLKDYYLDREFILAKNNHYLRLRNWIYELKISDYNDKTKIDICEEYDNEEEINKKIKQFWITTDDVIWIMFVDTFREKYEYTFKWQKINIDIDKYQYWTRYEIEIVYGSIIWEERQKIEENIWNLIDDFREEIWLTAENDISSAKTITCAMHQNIDLFEIMTK